MKKDFKKMRTDIDKTIGSAINVSPYTLSEGSSIIVSGYHHIYELNYNGGKFCALVLPYVVYDRVIIEQPTIDTLKAKRLDAVVLYSTKTNDCAVLCFADNCRLLGCNIGLNSYGDTVHITDNAPKGIQDTQYDSGASIIGKILNIKDI